jgi:hypothetical protein
MTSAVAILALQFVAASEPINAYWPSGRSPWNYQIGYAAMKGKECLAGLSEQVEVAFITDKTVDGVSLDMHQCYNKCAGKPATGDCADFDATVDTISNTSVCGDLALLKAACDAAAECKGFHQVVGKKKGFLLKGDCMTEALAGLADSTVYDFYAKMDPETAGGEGCPMGMAVLAYGLEDLTGMCPELEDKEQYNPEDDKSFGSGCGNIIWSPNGCGWLVKAPPADAADGTDLEDCDAATCMNHVPEANWIFGFDGAEYDVDICMRTEPWLAAGGYCQNALWKALCPEMCPDVDCDTCTAWEKDNADASMVLTDMLSLDATGGACAALKTANMCEDPVVKVTCMGTCSASEERRLTAAETEAHLASARRVYGTRFRHILSTIEAQLIIAGRRLDSHTVSLYGSWDPSAPLADGICPDLSKSAGAPADYTLLDTTDWYDWRTWLGTKLEINIMPECPDQATYLTASDMYCDTNNMNIMAIPVSDAFPQAKYDAITEDLCWKKCATVDANGLLPEFCEGFDPAFNAYSNALCVPRSTCESYCDDLGGMCAGLEMHTEVPRCYLITDVCLDTVSSTKYDQVTKAMAPIRYYTHNLMKCGLADEASPLIPEMTGEKREECEKKCSENVDCGGFEYEPATGRCTFRSISRTGFAPAAYCSGGTMTFASVTPTSNTLVATTGAHYVEKMMNGVSVESPWSPPCKAALSAPAPMDLPFPLPGTALASYTRTLAADCGAPVQDEVCYMSPSSQYRLVWGNQAKGPAASMMYLEASTGIPRKCSGWVLEELGTSGYEPVYATYLAEGFDCLTAPVTYSLNKPAPGSGDVGGYVGMYSWKPVMAMGVSMNFVCKSYPMCGTLQTCVLAKNRFMSEVDILLTQGAVMASPVGFLSDLPEDSYKQLLDPVAFRPKTLISVEMAILFVAKVKAQYGAELYRNVPGNLRIKIADLGMGVSSAVIKMVSAAGTTKFGKKYEIPEQKTSPTGYEPWYTDVVRVEKFGPGGVLDAGGPMTIDFYAPTVPNLMVVGFKKDSSIIGYFPASMVPGSPGYWRVQVAVSGDYIGTTESMCPAVPFGAANGTVCPDVDAGATCNVVCDQPNIPMGALKCSLGKWTDGGCMAVPGYEAETQLFRLSHRSRLDYGWRIRKIMAFSDAACTDLINSNLITITGPSESYLDKYPAEEGQKSIRTSNLNAETECLTGGSSDCFDFWSKGLNVNPYLVDETHGGAAFLEFTIDKLESVQCVVVVSRTKTGAKAAPKPRQYYPEEMTLHRGFYAAADESPLEQSMISKEGWTTFWTATASGSEQKDEGLFTTFTTSCGMQNTRIYGELLELVSRVPSPCHCKQLCIDKIVDGCVSWNFFVPDPPYKKGNAVTSEGDCILQSTIKSVPEDTCEESLGYISGDTGFRFEGLTPMTIAPGTTFDLTIKGTNMPTSESAVIQETTPPRQRIKIVEQGAVCAEAEVSEFVDGIGCSHPYFCAPKPSKTSATDATWSGLKIFPAEMNKYYTVCYNKGLTYDRYEWFPVGDVFVPMTPFTFKTMPPKLMRNTPSFSLTVERPPLTEYSMTTNWAIKLVKSYFDCSKSTDAKLVFDLADKTVAPETATFPDISLYDEGELVFADVGLYKVCFSKDGTTFEQIPSAAGDVYLEIAAVEGDSSHARAVYSYQTLSGKTDAKNTFVLKGNALYLPSGSGLGFFAGATCSGASVFTATVDELASTAEGYVFTGTVPAIAAGEYTMCYCDDKDADGNSTAIGENVYLVNQDYVCELGLPYSDLTADAMSDVCTVKCAKGCTGADCFCDSFDHADYVASPVANESYPLCVSAVTCRKYCSAVDTCTGFNYDPATNMCTLLTGDCAGNLTLKEGSEYWPRLANASACADDADYSTVVGKVTLTARVDIGVDWVLTPGETASVEVISTGKKDLDWQKDRLMIIDCTGICGVSGPTASVMKGPMSQMHYNHWVAVTPDFDDPPHDDMEVPKSFTPPPPIATVYWRSSPGSYCAGNNMDVVSSPKPEVYRHQCYAKCVAGAPCAGADCFCDGLMQGYDGPDSQALCLDESTCKDVCAGLDDCFGIDMHATKNRCFLNGMLKGSADTYSCEESVVNGKLTKFPTYGFFYKQLPNTRRAAAVEAEAPARGLLPAIDLGKSWGEILRFKNITFESGGKFKACFCDYDTLAAGKYCKMASDYKIEIGTVHVSGVSCLVEESKFQRGTCVAQFYGGLRCYPGAAPVLTVPPAPSPTIPSAPAPAPPAFDPALSSFCLYGPEEETRDDPLCNM